MVQKGTILIADDEPDIVSFMQQYLEDEGYDVITAYNGYEVLKRVEDSPDLIILDVMMPGMDGLSVCSTIRERVHCPILLLTARTSDRDKVQGFAAGADDYIVKPFGMEVLMARIEAHLRREQRGKRPIRQTSFGEVTIDYVRREVYIAHQMLSLTPKEFDVIQLLSLSPGQVFTRDQIYERVWGYDAIGDDTTVTEHVKRIRQKLSKETPKSYIETVWGVGYKWGLNARR